MIVVSDVPGKRHLAPVKSIRRQLSAYDRSHPDWIDTLAGSGECKIMVAGYESERHPDLAIYLTPMPDEDPWWTWVPEIVIEVVSRDSKGRDYTEKREEYLAFGVSEYWIVDCDKGELRVLRRRGSKWTERIVRPPQTYQTRLLPGFELNLAEVFAAARSAAE